MTNQRTQHYYQDAQNARQFEESRFYGAFGAWLNAADVGFFAENPWVDYGALSRVLELGCGTGRITRPLHRVATAAQVVALDRSAEMLAELAHRWEGGVPANLLLQQAGVDSLDFPARSFDLVLFSRLLMHIENWQEMLAQVCGLSRQWILFDMPVQGSLASVGKRALDFFRPQGGDGDYQFFHLPQVVALLDHHRFEVVACRRLLILPIPVHLRVGHPALTLGVERVLGGAWLRQRVGSPVYLVARRR